MMRMLLQFWFALSNHLHTYLLVNMPQGQTPSAGQLKNTYKRSVQCTQNTSESFTIDTELGKLLQESEHFSAEAVKLLITLWRQCDHPQA